MTAEAAGGGAEPLRERIGLIAGYGVFPFLVVEGARRQGLDVAVAAIRGEANPELARHASAIQWIWVSQISKTIRFFQKCGVKRCTMAGKVHKVKMYSWRKIFWFLLDYRAVRLWWRARWNRKDDALLGAVADALESGGIHLMDSTHLVKDLLAKRGILTRRQPDAREMRDVRYGWTLAKEMGRLDIGQTVIVKDAAVLAVEAIEGTDEAIRRGGRLGKGGIVVVKVAKPRQDMRFDVPAIGPDTIRTLKDVQASVLAIEAEKTLILEPEETIRLADEEDIAIVALDKTLIDAMGSPEGARSEPEDPK